MPQTAEPCRALCSVLLSVVLLCAWPAAQAVSAAPSVAPDQPELALVERIQHHFNRLKRLPDPWLWGQADYWATPSELLRAGGGDCEDLAAAKYFALRELGVPAERLRLVYTRVLNDRLQRIELHIVLWYRRRPGDEWLVLDSLRDDVQPLSRRSDLLPRLTFNEEHVARWETEGRERAQGNTRLLKRWHQLLVRQRMADSVAMVIYLHNLL